MNSKTDDMDQIMKHCIQGDGPFPQFLRAVVRQVHLTPDEFRCFCDAKLLSTTLAGRLSESRWRLGGI
jgi:hypothetical protein